MASRGYGSYAYNYPHEIHLGQGADWYTLVHEVAHFVQFKRGFGTRPDGKRSVHDRAFYYILKEIHEKLQPGLRISFAPVSGWGYAVDSIIASQIRSF